MRLLLTLFTLSAIILLSGCFLRFQSEGLRVEAGSSYPPTEQVKTPDNSTTKEVN